MILNSLRRVYNLAKHTPQVFEKLFIYRSRIDLNIVFRWYQNYFNIDLGISTLNTSNEDYFSESDRKSLESFISNRSYSVPLNNSKQLKGLVDEFYRIGLETPENQIKNSQWNHNIFLLGVFGKCLSVYQLQTEAANLIYSLVITKNLNLNDKLTIIGGGISGVMAGCMAAIMGCKSITIFEQNPDLISSWSSCTTRWLHPNLFRWPKNGWKNKSTDLPILNWHADIASNVAKKIKSDFKVMLDYFGDKIDFKVQCDSKVRFNQSNRIFWGNFGESKDFDKIIIATGFSRDGKKQDENSCYWANDNVEVLPEKKDEYFLSGNGDSGIMELFRIRIKNYNYNLIEELLSIDEIKKIERELVKVEKAIDYFKINNDRLSIHQYIANEYEKIKTPILEKGIKERLRHDTSVIFHSKDEYIYKTDSFPLNRFLLSRYLNIKDKQFEFVYGEIMNLEELKNTNFSRETFSIYVKNFGQKKANKFIMRHGAKSSINQSGFNHIQDDKRLINMKLRYKWNIKTYAFVFNKTEIKKNNKVLFKKIALNQKESHNVSYVNAMPFFSKSHEMMLNQEVDNSISMAYNELVIPNKVFKTEQDYLFGLMEILQHLELGSSINAVCGSKEWTSNWVKEYFNMNYEAAKRGVNIHRIFLLQDGERGIDQRKIIEEQKQNNIIVSEVPFDVGVRVMNENKVPPSFGFAIISRPGIEKQIILHDLSENSNLPFTGVKLTSQILIRYYDRLWNSLYRDSSEFINKFTK